MRRFVVAANWKMNGSLDQIHDLLSQMCSPLDELFKRSDNEVIICPPFVYLPTLSEVLKETHIRLGAQDVSQFSSGAYTGQISAQMIQEMGGQYVIVGHSERRQYNRETDEEVAAKFFQAKSQGLTPILCLGESQAQRQAGQTLEVVLGQLECIIERAGEYALENALIAYEPLWAIGTGEVATPEQAQEVHEAIRTRIAQISQQVALQIPILYGGSVHPDNCHALFAMPDIDGGLVGGASLKAQEFVAICQSQSIGSHV